MSRLSAVLRAVVSAFTPSRSRSDSPPSAQAPPTGIRTRRVAPPSPKGLRIAYAPELDGAPDAGEIVWTWVPFDEGDGRGKDRPVLVIARQDASRVYAVRMTSRPHDADPDQLALGAGPWDARQRPSWVDLSRLYSVHLDGMRREAAALDLERFVKVANALHRRYGWDAA